MVNEGEKFESVQSIRLVMFVKKLYLNKSIQDGDMDHANI
jgi:hypothetical protein